MRKSGNRGLSRRVECLQFLGKFRQARAKFVGDIGGIASPLTFEVERQVGQFSAQSVEPGKKRVIGTEDEHRRTQLETITLKPP